MSDPAPPPRKPSGTPPRTPPGKHPQTLLALDAAGPSCSAAVWSAGAIRAQADEAMSRGQSERLVPMLQQVMSAAHVEFGDLDAIAVTRGPGGFTGVRIGLATARGLGLALQRPVVGLSNFEVLAAIALSSGAPALRPGQSLIAAIEAKRAEIYVQVFRVATEGAMGAAAAPLAEGPGQALLPESLDAVVAPGPVVLVGDAAQAAARGLRAAGREVEVVRPEGQSLAALVAKLAAGRPLPPADAGLPQPIYLRGADVTLPDGSKAQATL